MSNKNLPMLGINIDHVATIRQARGTSYPSVLQAAHLAISGGADQITIHLREDRRHIQDKDVYDLKKAISAPLNLEMAAEDEIVDIALDAKPAIATLVPEKRQELTTEGGLDCISNKQKLLEVIKRLAGGGIVVSLFIDPEKKQIEMARELNAAAVELHTGTYCGMAGGAGQKTELEKLKDAARLAKGLGLKVSAGHGLNYDNAAGVVSHIPEIVEYNIGHAIVARAVFVGLKKAVEEMASIMRSNYDYRNWNRSC